MRHVPALVPAMLLAAAGAMLVGGCGSQTSSPATAGGNTGATQSAGSTSTGSSTPESTPTSTGSPQECSTSDLDVTMTAGDGAAGSIYSNIVLTNMSKSPCITGGFGGVSYVGQAGKQIGAPADRQGKGSLITLAPRGQASAVLQQSEAGNYGAAQCKPTKTLGFRIYPPNQTAAVFVKQAGTGCASMKVHLLALRPYKADN